MKRLNLFLFLTGFVFAQNTAYATLPASAISNFTLSLYGLYTTADPLCQTGLIATIPLSATATAFNFAASPSPTLGTGSVSTPINCVVMVMSTGVSSTYAAGAYTTTSASGGGTNSDSSCNAGGTFAQYVCRGTTPNYPTQVVTDAAAVGLTLPGTCPSSPVAAQAVVGYLSTDSACTGQSTLDTGTPACVTIDSGQGPNAFQAPTAAADAAHGIKLNQLTGGGGSYVFTVGVSGTIGGGGGSTCESISAPTFSIAL